MHSQASWQAFSPMPLTWAALWLYGSIGIPHLVRNTVRDQDIFINQQRSRCITLATLATLSLKSAYAQARFGQVTSPVADKNGSTVPVAAPRARSIETNVTSDTVNSRDGNYNILSLIPGKYEVIAEKAGFDRQLVSACVRATIVIRLGVATELRVDVADCAGKHPAS